MRRVRLLVQPGAIRQLASLPKRDRERLIAKAEDFAADPVASHPWAKPLEGQPDRVRIRQGDWRGVGLIVRPRDTVLLEGVGHRREAYR
jgi:mRNA-degrading endonuclease RelE of RelBE toxin-antitoxin system